MRPKVMTLSIICAVAVAGLFGPGRQPSSAQNFKSYQLRVYCAPEIPTAVFWHDVKGNPNSMGLAPIICAGNCSGRKVSLADALAGLPAAVSAALRTQVENAPAEKVGCVVGGPDDKKPPEDKKPKCEPPTNIPEPPWLNPDLPCREWTKGTISWTVIRRTRDRAYKVSMCGEVISYTLPRGAGPPPKGAFGGGTYTNAPGVRVFDVCCDSWRNAANTKSPCDARRDIDCDGSLNEVDRFADIPEDNRSWRDYFFYNGPYSGAPNVDIWTKFHPPDQSECKDCKWELVRYESTCKNVPNLGASDRTGMDIFDAKHKVKATWKCPASGQTKENEETVTVQSAGCPRPEPTPPGFRP